MMDKSKKQMPTFQVKPPSWGFHSKEGGRHANEDRAVAITKERLWLSLEKARLKANKVKEKESRKAKKIKLPFSTSASAVSATPPQPQQPPPSSTQPQPQQLQQSSQPPSTQQPQQPPPSSEGGKPASPRIPRRPEKKRSQVFEGAAVNEQELALIASQVQFGASFFAVYDGHGGKKTVNYLKKHLHKNIINQETRQLFFTSSDQDIDELGIVKAIFRGFRKTEQEIMEMLPKRDESGACAVVVIQFAYRLFVANLGDSRAVIARQRETPVLSPPDSPRGPYSTSLPSSFGGSGGSSTSSAPSSNSPPATFGGRAESMYKALMLTKDHKAIESKELKRIYAQGGWVSFNRVFGILAVSRSFGDLLVKGQQPPPPPPSDQQQPPSGATTAAPDSAKPMSPKKKRRLIMLEREAATSSGSLEENSKDKQPTSPPRTRKDRPKKPRSKSVDKLTAFTSPRKAPAPQSPLNPTSSASKRRPSKEDALFLNDVQDLLDLPFPPEKPAASTTTTPPEVPAVPVPVGTLSNSDGTSPRKRAPSSPKAPKLVLSAPEDDSKRITPPSPRRKDTGDDGDSDRPDDEIDTDDVHMRAPPPQKRGGSRAKSHKRSSSLNLEPQGGPKPGPATEKPVKPNKPPRESHSDSEAEEVPDKGWVKFIKDSASKGAKKVSKNSNKEWLWDQAAKAPPGVVIAVPVVKIFRRKPHDRFLLLATDGVWDVMSNSAAVDYIGAKLKAKKDKNKKTLARGDLNDLCQELNKRARKLGSLDDITSVLVLFE